TWSGYGFVALLLALTGLLYNAFAVGKSAKYSADVLSDYLYLASGTTMAAALFLSMRTLAEERQTGSYPLLASSPLTDGQVVVAKFFSAYAVVGLYILSTLYMPALVFVNGSVSLGHIFAGYVGLFAVGAAATGIGVFGSAVARSQLFAIIISAVILVVLLAVWLAASLADGAIGDVLGYLALHNKHFRPFMEGRIGLSHLVYYFSITLVFLTLARNVLEARRWRS
ncbi:MAG: hypothetical protein AAFU79_27240, partial [Myxococcota bacterium]